MDPLISDKNTKQLLDEVEHNMNYQCQGLSYLPKLRAKADQQRDENDNLWYHAKTKFNNWFIIHFLNNLQKRTLCSGCAKVWEH